MEIRLIHGDITTVETDAIVNAAKSSLLGGSGVDGAIHLAGGKEILDECIAIRDRQGGCPVGEAVITNAGKLKAKKIIHTVGPTYTNGKSNEPEQLRNCYLNSLKLAEEYELTSIAFPNISTGNFGYPKEEAARIAIETVRSFEPTTLIKAYFVCFDDENYQLYQSLNG